VLAIEVELLAGRYVAAKFNDRSTHEWPIHPARFFAAMVAAWGQTDEPSREEADSMRTLELLGAPEIIADPEPAYRSVVTHFVPDNDVSAASDLTGGYNKILGLQNDLLSGLLPKDLERVMKLMQKQIDKSIVDSAKATAAPASINSVSMSIMESVIQVLPEDRGKQGRSYPTVVPNSPHIVFLWPDAELSETDRQNLDAVASRVHRIGHSSTLVSCRVVPPTEALEPSTFTPAEGRKAIGLRIPAKGMFDRLVADYVINPGVEPRTTPARSAAYCRTRESRPEAPRSNLAGDLLVLPFRTEDADSKAESVSYARMNRPGIAKGLELARALRGALLSHGPQPPPSILSGHEAGEAPTSALRGPHAACLALPHVGGNHGDGRLFGMAVLLPSELTDIENQLVREAITEWARTESPLVTGALRQHIDFTQKPSQVALRETTWSGSAKTWISTFPIALDRFTTKRLSDSDAALDEAAQIVADSCVMIGLPAPVEVRTSLQPMLRGSKPVRAFPGPIIGGRPRSCVHASVTWESPVSGPIVLGAARYLGYGLMFPLSDERTEMA
jgi:CRISPR-associated protein Csb2